MAWSFVGVSAPVTVTTAAHTLTEPAGVVQGDLLIAIFSSRIASTASMASGTNWVNVTEQKTNNVVAAASTSIASGSMWYCIRGSVAPSYAFTHPVAPSVAMGQVVAYRGGDQTLPVDIATSFTTATGVTAVSGGGLTTTAAGDLIVVGACGGRGAAWSAFDAATDPTTVSGAGGQTGGPTAGTWLERADNLTATGADTSLGIADAIRAPQVLPAT